MNQHNQKLQTPIKLSTDITYTEDNITMDNVTCISMLDQSEYHFQYAEF